MENSFNNTKENQIQNTSGESMLESTSGILEKLHRTSSTNDSGIGHMDISKNTYSDSEISNCSSPESDTKYFCPLCDQIYTSQHEFTIHIRSHNTDNEIVNVDKGFSCKICSKTLSSGSSLDRHMLVHSGERPFSCKICSVTFTTNGNMHRHMRTHSQKGENYESDGSTDSNASNSGSRPRKRRLEFNNNKLENRSKECFEDEELIPKKPRHINNNNINEASSQVFRCPICSRDDFPSINVLEQHLEDNHPDFEVKCNLCNANFKNHKDLNIHKYMVHTSDIITANKNLKNSITGFKDLTFVDFSSEKFPHIARYACEKSPHKPITGQKFICDDCSLAFPCASALEIHQQDCRKKGNPTDLSRKSDSEEDLRRDNFFAHLDLQNKSKPSSPTNEVQEPLKIEKPIENSQIDSKDLADIQSILSMTSNGSLLQHLRPKPTPELLAIPPEGHKNSDHPEEETQDAFAAEFRKMKLRGEFPCRLCTAVFPNLRALKGHNRAHLSGNTGPYRCNMCPHSSVDKAALIRHMRTHNGDRPYECSLCNYAFTTKANCERHLRNRHAKVTREEVKKSIIYHPSEDPTNDDKLNSTRDELKRSFLNSSNEDVEKSQNSSTPKDRHPDFGLLMPKELGLGINIPTITKDLSFKEKSPLIQVNKELAVFKERHSKDEPLKPNFNILREKIEETFSSKNNFNSIDGLKQIPEYEPEESLKDSSQNSSGFEDYSKRDEHPIDLSMDVLDLSKKKRPSSPESSEEPCDFTKKTLENSIPPGLPPAAQFLLAQQFLKNPLYQNYAALIPGLQNLPLPQIPINPFLFSSPFLNAAQEMKERMLRLQLQSGGSMIMDQFSPIHSERPNFQNIQPEVNFPKVDTDEKVPLHINTHLTDNSMKIQSPKAQKTPDISHSPNSVKMVIKNGVLMPKQKQRRYRTERPFSCEHCSARFTLRSNMERHIKQQHPQFWSQRQRSGLSAGRKPIGPISSTPIPPPKTYYDLNIPNYDLTIPKVDPIVNDTKEPLSISQQVKYAILAQHLKANKDLYNENYPSPKEKLDDDEDALIIDEENDDKNKNDLQTPPETSNEVKMKSLEEKLLELRQLRESEINSLKSKEDGLDLVSPARLLNNAVSGQFSKDFGEYLRREGEEAEIEPIGSEEDEEGLIASASASEGNGSSCDENKSENENNASAGPVKKKSAYSLAPNRVSCPYCSRKFPWTSSLRRHILTHTGQKPFKCPQCPLLFTTKSNCDRHLLRKHGNNSQSSNNENKNNSQNFMMRNVPERPYKCSNCPSSTFSTLSNLNKHMSCKHLKSDGEKRSDYESHASSEDERNVSDKIIENKDWEHQISHTKIQNEALPNSELPFKCHLCEGSFAERQEALDHIKEIHVAEYELLISKGALDQNVTEEVHQSHETEDDDQIRGKFPDYANRKVVCAFCMRRFWSAEDLRRHMRTHSGERPFSCDVCRRRFTLKHSMLRHRKKHNTMNNDEIQISGDEENIYEKLNLTKINNNNNLESKNEKSDDSEGNEGNDLIGNLLGIRDKSLIDQVLDGSADDAAKLLGVNSGRE